MNNEKILSGHELVSKGATKIEATLPESGVKNVFPSGSWLEQKQIQAAIEARQHLIEVERIEKSGALSHAVWREELNLAEVTQKVGGYWQYLGHNKGKQLFLKPEETLFLMEINCLQLKFHDVKVSLQQAYSLLLTEKITLLQYKVYASLSRLGYRVYRHEKSETIANNKEDVIKSPNVVKVNNNKPGYNDSYENNTKQTLLNQKHSANIIESGNSTRDTEITEQNCEEKIDEVYNKKINRKDKALYGRKKLQKLKNRALKPCNVKHIHRFFDTLPDLTAKHIVSIKAPQKRSIPNSIHLNKPIFSIDLKNIHTKNDRPIFNDTNIYTNDEVNDSHIRRLSNRSESAVPPYSNLMFSSENFQYRQYNYNFWRPRQAYNYVNFNMLLQRQFFWNFTPRFQMPRFETQYWQTNFHNTFRNYTQRNNTPRNFNTNRSINNGNRNCNDNYRNVNNKISRVATQKQNLEEIQKLAARLKHLILRGISNKRNIISLQRLIQSYNTKYRTRVRLSNDFNVIVEETIVDTIEIHDDGEPSNKRRRSNDQNHEHDDNLKMLKNFASQLKELEKNNKSSARYRRAFSKLLRTFNESYNEEYYLNESYEVRNRLHITLDTSDSSSEECLIEEPKLHKRKKLRNPFNILKRLSARQNELCSEASTSKNDNCIELESKKYSEDLLKTFSKGWLPPEDDFGRAEVVSKEDVANEITDMKREEFLFDFLKIQNCNCNNWLDLKKSFFTSIKEAVEEFHGNAPENNRINSIVKPGDSTDIGSILKKLRIIQTANADEQCHLAIDFDVFNRDVQNFKKTKKPTPHFRIICFDETIHIPSGGEIASLHSEYKDNVIIVFAIVGIDSISYVQINPTNLPVYISNNT